MADPSVGFRFSEADKAEMDRLKKLLGLRSRAEAIRVAVRHYLRELKGVKRV